MPAIKEKDTGSYLRWVTQQRFFDLLRVGYWPERGAALDAELARARREAGARESAVRGPARDDLDPLVSASLERARPVLDALAGEPHAEFRRGWDRRESAREQWLASQDRLERPLPRELRVPFAIGQGSLGTIGPPARWEELKAAKGSEFGTLRALLEAWARRWGLGADWCLDIALATLALWCATPETVAQRFLTRGGHGSRISLMAYEIPWWDPSSSEDFDAFKRRARAELRAQFEEDLRETERWAGEQQWPLRKPAFSEASYAWLIRYQVLGDSCYRIAQDFARDDGQVRRAVRGLATYLQLPLRTDAPGRRRGSKTQTRLHP